MKNKYTRKVLLSLGMGLLGSIAANAQQKIGNNPGTLNPGAILELESTNRGFLLPRVSLPTTLTTFGLNGQPTVESNGMMVYNTNASTPGGVGYYVWSGTTAPNTGGTWNRIFTGTLPVTSNIYTANGVLTGNRTVDKSTFNLTFGGSGSTFFNGGNVVNTSEDAALIWDSGLDRRFGFVKKTGLAPFIASGSATPITFATASLANIDNVATTTYATRMSISQTGAVTINNLAGTGSRMVVADAAGVLSTQALPTASVTGAANGLSLVTGNVELGGALTKATTLTLGTQSLTFNASGTAQVIIQGPAGNTAGLRLSNLTGAGTAGTSGQKVLSVNASGDVVLVTDFGTANAGTVTNVTGTAPIVVANGSTTPAISLAPLGVTSAFLADGAVTTAKLAPAGTAGQVLTSTGGTTAPTWQTLPVTSNIYTANGALTENRTVSQGTNNLIFSGSGKAVFGSTNASTIVNSGRVSAVTNTNLMPAFTVMNDSTSRIGNAATIAFRTQGSNAPLGNTAAISALQTGSGSESALIFNTYNGLNTGERMRIASNGAVSINNLAGTGSRMVVADANGVLNTQAVPTTSNIYTADGTLTGARTLSMGTHEIRFEGTGGNSFTVSNSNQRAGIVIENTATPGVNNTTEVRFRNSNGTSTADHIQIVASDANSVGAYARNALSFVNRRANGQYQFFIGGSDTSNEVVRIDTAGRLGLGTRTPTQRLHVAGGALISSLAGTGSRMVVADANGVLNTQAVPTTSNIYTADGTLTGTRTVNLGTNGLRFVSSGLGGALTIDNGDRSTNYRISAVGDTLELQTGANSNQIALLPNGFVSIGTYGFNTAPNPTSTLDVNGSVSYAIRKITQTGATRALGLAAAARTVGATDHTVLVNTSVNPEGIEIILPNPVLASGREYIIRKIDDSSNPVLFSYAVSGAIPAVTAGGNAILVSEGTTNQFVGSMNFVKTLRIQSNGTNWILID